MLKGRRADRCTEPGNRGGAKALKIEVHDHLVICRDTRASFKALGLL
jgi:DNA repair protein RadC